MTPIYQEEIKYSPNRRICGPVGTTYDQLITPGKNLAALSRVDVGTWC